MNITEFLEKHTILTVGSKPNANYIASEVIVDDPYGLIAVMDFDKCYISEILWWDRVRISASSTIGYGGPCDPRAPNDYRFAETYICENFKETTTKDEYIKYLDKTFDVYKKFEIYPAFDIEKKT